MGWLSSDPNLSWKKNIHFVHGGFFTKWLPFRTLGFVHDRVGIRHKTLGIQPGPLGLATPSPENDVSPWNFMVLCMIGSGSVTKWVVEKVVHFVNDSSFTKKNICFHFVNDS